MLVVKNAFSTYIFLTTISRLILHLETQIFQYVLITFMWRELHLRSLIYAVVFVL